MVALIFQRYLPTALLATATTKLRISTAAARMGSNRGNDDERFKDPSFNPKVAKFRNLLSLDSTGGWEKCWEEGLTPWDLGQPTPVVLHLLQTGALPKGRVLVPGCGSGYDVVAIASPERYVVGLDISNNAVIKAKEHLPNLLHESKCQWTSSLQNVNYFTFLATNFFTWHPTELFDLVFDYTFFCAIDPCMRSAWANKISDILKPDGELITLIYPIIDQVGGPPYSVSPADYKEVLNPVGFKALSIVDNEQAIERRKGMEKLGRWKRCLNHSLM